MIQACNIFSSKKKMGKYEEKIIYDLTTFFNINGYETIPHCRFNLAWSTILSDVDLLLLKDGLLTYIEVKSCRDNIQRAFKQIERIKDYIDYAYTATDKQIKNWDAPKIGLIYMNNNHPTLIKKSEKFASSPSFSSIFALKKKCLTRFLNTDEPQQTSVYKYDLAKYVHEVRSNECTRECLKEIVTCKENCDTFCPIKKFIKEF